MFVELITKIGEPPLRMEVSQILLRHADGTPLVVAGVHSDQRLVQLSRAGDHDFNRTLHAFGYGQQAVVVCPVAGPRTVSDLQGV